MAGALWLLAGGAALAGATASAVRATRGTATQAARRRYSRLLGRADDGLRLLDRHVRALRALKRRKLPRLFRHDDRGVRSALAAAHRVENRVCLAFAELHDEKARREVHMTTAQVARFRRVLGKYRAAARRLRELERAARAKGLRFDRGRACKGDAPDPERLERERERRQGRRRQANWRAASRRREAEQRESHAADDEARELRRQLQEQLTEQYEDDDEAWAAELAEDYDMLREIHRVDAALLARLANDYEAILDGARAIGLLDHTRSAF